MNRTKRKEKNNEKENDLKQKRIAWYFKVQTRKIVGKCYRDMQGASTSLSEGLKSWRKTLSKLQRYWSKVLTKSRAAVSVRGPVRLVYKTRTLFRKVAQFSFIGTSFRRGEIVLRAAHRWYSCQKKCPFYHCHLLLCLANDSDAFVTAATSAIYLLASTLARPSYIAIYKMYIIFAQVNRKTHRKWTKLLDQVTGLYIWRTLGWTINYTICTYPITTVNQIDNLSLISNNN